jgi:hypothetical protein
VTGILAHRVLRESCRCADCTAETRMGRPVRAGDGTRIVSIEALGGNMLQLVCSMTATSAGLSPSLSALAGGARHLIR